jgi:hypothetical protein
MIEMPTLGSSHRCGKNDGSIAMRMITKCFATGLSALIAVTSYVPASAMPLPVVQSRVADSALPVEKVQTRRDRDFARDLRRSDRRKWIKRGKRWDNRAGYYRGHRGYRHARPGYRQHNGFWFPLAAFGAGAIIGGAVSRDRSYGGSHTQWCANRWASYRAYDNTYQPYNGGRRQCVSPYS